MKPMQDIHAAFSRILDGKHTMRVPPDNDRDEDLIVASALAELGQLRATIQQQASELDLATSKEAQRWADRLNWLHTEYGSDCSGVDSGDLLDCVESEIRQAIEKYEQNTCDVCSPDDYGWQHNRVEGRVPCVCMEEAEPYQILKSELERQAKEIERLREALNRMVGTLAEHDNNPYCQLFDDDDARALFLAREAFKDSEPVKGGGK